MKNINQIILSISLLLTATLAIIFSQPTLAVGGPVSPTAPPTNVTSGNTSPTDVCPKSKFPQMPKPCTGEYVCNSNNTDCVANNPIMQWVVYFINLLASVIGVGAVLMVIVAGLQYAAARDNPQVIQAAKMRLVNVLIGVGAFIFIYSFLQWLVPGGVF